MILQVDTDSAVPPYDQIRAQVQTMVESGVLAPGTRLPTIRQLAGDLGVASGTVARAYRELERVGIVVARGRHGTIIAERTHEPDRAVSEARLTEAAESFAAAAHHSGSDLDHAIHALRTAYGRIRRPAVPPPTGTNQ